MNKTHFILSAILTLLTILFLISGINAEVTHLIFLSVLLFGVIFATVLLFIYGLIGIKNYIVYKNK